MESEKNVDKPIENVKFPRAVSSIINMNYHELLSGKSQLPKTIRKTEKMVDDTIEIDPYTIKYAIEFENLVSPINFNVSLSLVSLS